MCNTGDNAKGCSCGEARITVKERTEWFGPITKKIEKGWGYELIIHNGDGYCGKILHFNNNGMCSMHLHLKKHETFYVASGQFVLKIIDSKTGDIFLTNLSVGDIFVIKPMLPHQLFATEEGEIFETSTEDDVDDSYRMWKGDSQK